MAENEINTVHVLIRRFLYEIDDVIKDKDESHKWLVSFAKTLQFQDLCKTPNEYALTLLREAKEFCLSQRKKSQIKQVRKILADEGNASPTKEQIETRWAELYGNETSVEDGAMESTRTDGHSLRVGNVARPPVRSSLAYAGRGGNVRLTDDEYAMLLQELGNKRKADKLIDSLDYSISEGKTFNAPHFHVLMHWNDYREEKAAEAAEMAKVNADARAEAFSRRGYKTAEERQQEELAKINDFCTGLRNGTIKIAKEG